MSKKNIRALIRTMYDFQDLRIRMANRLAKKKDGSDQAVVDKRELWVAEIPVMVDVWQDACNIEKKLAKAIENELAGIEIYKRFLKEVIGCGPLMSAVLISEIDIEKATTVSKIWQYAGLNAGMVKGNKAEGSKKDGTFKVIKTNDLVRGDKKTPGYLCPYNSWLRSKLMGVLAPLFIKHNSPYRKYYDEYKKRLEHSEKMVKHSGKDMPWKDVSKAHRDMAAKRYMIKMFLLDLYKVWRELEGLPIRKPYLEEYLGKTHCA